MIYSEAAYFDNHPCQHCADHEEITRLARVKAQTHLAQQLSRRALPRVLACS